MTNYFNQDTTLEPSAIVRIGDLADKLRSEARRYST